MRRSAKAKAMRARTSSNARPATSGAAAVLHRNVRGTRADSTRAKISRPRSYPLTATTKPPRAPGVLSGRSCEGVKGGSAHHQRMSDRLPFKLPGRNRVLQTLRVCRKGRHPNLLFHFHPSVHSLADDMADVHDRILMNDIRCCHLTIALPRADRYFGTAALAKYLNP